MAKEKAARGPAITTMKAMIYTQIAFAFAINKAGSERKLAELMGELPQKVNRIVQGTGIASVSDLLLALEVAGVDFYELHLAVREFTDHVMVHYALVLDSTLNTAGDRMAAAQTVKELHHAWVVDKIFKRKK